MPPCGSPPLKLPSFLPSFLPCTPLQALQHYGDTPSPYQQLAAELHRQLRWNLVHTLVREYRRTGYIWEQYSDVGGEGKGSHPFTGWSALLVLMAAAEQ